MPAWVEDELHRQRDEAPLHMRPQKRAKKRHDTGFELDRTLEAADSGTTAATFKQWCEANGYDPETRTYRKS